ncbi:MAG: hypothetical protein HY764_02585 [Candidatus Portnoybacteria bacterium]|nr:hypothetical protein [Candidatus Portnoybacteria bacterium]
MKKDFWVYELLFGDSRQGFKAKEKLFFKKTPYQKIKIFDSYRFKKILTLDDVVQTTQADEFIYHEMISHVPLLLHPNPKKVLIILLTQSVQPKGFSPVIFTLISRNV